MNAITVGVGDLQVSSENHTFEIGKRNVARTLRATEAAA